MNNENSTNSKRGIVIKIVTPVLILIVIVGIWFVKNNKKDANLYETDQSGTIVSENTGTASSSPETENPDFALHVTEKIDLEKLKSYGLPIIIDFGSDQCIPCKAMAPVLKELNAELQGKAIIRFVDVWKYRELSQGYPISVIPTQIFVDAKGKPYNPKDPEAKQLKQYTSKITGELEFTAHEGGATKDQLLDALKEMGMK